MAVGIEKIAAWPCTQALDMHALAEARGRPVSYVSDALMVDRRCVNPLWEDPVTMAVNAARDLLDDYDRMALQLVVVGTESGNDFGKPIGTYVHRFLELGPNCRNWETKHACYGGTAALMTAAHVVAATGGKALVIATDQSRMHLGVPWEFVMGAGAVAMLVSQDPRVLALDLDQHGFWTDEVGDTFRPTSTEEAGNTEESVYCYLEALEGAVDHYERRVGPFDPDAMAGSVYHAPFGGMAQRAHRMLLRRARPISREEADRHFAERVAPSLKYLRQVGGTYTASVFFGLLGLMEGLRPGDPVSVLSYGSGSMAEVYTARVGPDGPTASAGLADLIERRLPISVADYEALEQRRTAWIDRPTYEVPLEGPLWDRAYAGQRHLVLRELDNFFRDYGWS